MKTRTVLLGCLLAMAVQAQDSKRELWTWKDANGVTQYSDRPVPGAKKFELSGVSQPATPTVAPAAAATESPAGPQVPAPVQYTMLEFVNPQNEEAFFDADVSVAVRLRSEPELAAGHRLVIYLDGAQVGEGYEQTLSELARGAHSLMAVILDDQGNERIRSAPRAFYLKQPTTISPRAMGPNVRPPPRPTPR